MSVVGWTGALAPTQAAEERKKLEEKREDRKQLEAIIQGEIAALDEELFARLDVGGKGFLTPDDLKHLATASGEEWDELVIDSMFHAGVCVPASALCVCVCVCVCARARLRVSMCVSVSMCLQTHDAMIHSLPARRAAPNIAATLSQGAPL